MSALIFRLDPLVLNKIFQAHSIRWVFEVWIDILVQLRLLTLDVLLLARIFHCFLLRSCFTELILCLRITLAGLSRTCLLLLRLQRLLFKLGHILVLLHRLVLCCIWRQGKRFAAYRFVDWIWVWLERAVRLRLKQRLVQARLVSLGLPCEFQLSFTRNGFYCILLVLLLLSKLLIRVVSGTSGRLLCV